MNDNHERTRVWRRIGVIVLFAAAWIAASEAGPSPVAAQEAAEVVEVVEAPADYGVWSLVPAVLALVVAFALVVRRVALRQRARPEDGDSVRRLGRQGAAQDRHPR